MFVYHTLPENDSLILLIEYENEGYEVHFHAMSIGESTPFSFTQNKIPTKEERTTLFECVESLFHEQFVPNRLQDPFRYCILYGGLHYSKTH
jgi:hypothetical protein